MMNDEVPYHNSAGYIPLVIIPPVINPRNHDLANHNSAQS